MRTLKNHEKRCLFDEFAWVPFLRQLQRDENSEQRRTTDCKKNKSRNSPRDVQKNDSKIVDFGSPNGSKIIPGGLSETAGAPRSSQEQQTATKNRTTDPRAAQERPKEAQREDEGPG